MKKILYMVCLLPSLLYADSKVSSMVEDLIPKATDYTYIVANSTSMKVSVGNLLNSGSTNYLAVTTSATFNTSLTQISSFTAFGSSMPVSYVGISSLTASNGILTLSSAAVSYTAISTDNLKISYSSASVSYTAISTDALKISYSSASVSYLGISTNSVNTWTGSTITASTILIIPTAANPQVDSSGDFALDTSSGQIIAYNGSNTIVLASTKCVGLLNLETPAAGDFPPGFRLFADQRVTSLVCVSTAATSTTINFLDCNGSDGTSCNTLWSGASCGTTEFSVGLSSTVIQGRRVRAKVTSVSGTPGWIGADVCYTEIRR